MGMGSSLSTLVHIKRDDINPPLFSLPFYSRVHPSTGQQLKALRRQEPGMPYTHGIVPENLLHAH